MNVNVNFSVSTSNNLLDRSIAGEAEAWNRLNEIYTPMVYVWVRKCGLQPADARDITQQTFVKVFQGLHTFEKGTGRFRGWLWTISRNLVRDYAKSKRPIVDVDWDAIGVEPVADVDQAAASHELVPREVLQRALRYLVEEFDDRTQRIAMEVIMQGRQATEVAAELGMTANAVYIVKTRVLKKLRLLLADLEYPQSSGK